jgi:tetratricopeptide (TPR) repeat protein
VQYQKKGLLEQAYETFRAILAQHPDHVGSLLQSGIILFQKGEHEPSMDLLQRASALEPDNADIVFHLARLLEGQGRQTESLAALERVLELRPADAAARQEQCRLLLKLERYEPFFEAVSAGLESSPYDPALYLLKAEAFLKRGDHSRATDLLNLLLHHDPSLERALALLAEAYMLTQRVDKAIACVKRALLKNPDSAELHKLLGVCYGARGDRDLARGEFARARQLDPSMIITVQEAGTVREDRPEKWDDLTFQNYILARSDYYARTGAWRAAINEFLLLARKYQDRPIIWQELAAAFQNAGEYRRAYALYRKVLAMDPENLEVQLQLSRLALAIGSVAEARRFSEQTAASYPEVSEVAEIQGQVYLRAGDLDSAREAFQRAIDRNASNLDALAGLGLCHFRASEFSAARDVWERAHQAFPKSIHLALMCADAECALGQRVAAIKLLRDTKALAVASGMLIRPSAASGASQVTELHLPGSPLELIHRLGSLYLECGWPKKARTEWRELLSLWKGDVRDTPRVLEAMVFFREVREGLRLLRGYLQKHAATPELEFLAMLCHVLQKDGTKFWIPWQKVWKEQPGLFEQKANLLKAVLNRSDVGFLLAQMPRTHALFNGFPATMQYVQAVEEYLQRIQAIEPVTELSL